MNGKDLSVISKRKLIRNSLETCEFCDETFENRYNSLIHNASHIIIPLLRQNIVKCNKCFTYCTSLNELHQHIIVKHPLVIKTERLSLWDKNETKNLDKRKEKIEKKSPDNIISDDKIDTEVNKLVLHNGVSDSTDVNSDVSIINHGNDTNLDVKLDTKQLENEKNITNLKKSVKDRLIFENDDLLDELSNTSHLEKLSQSNNNEEIKSISRSFNGNDESNDTYKKDYGIDFDDTPLTWLTKDEIGKYVDETHFDALRQPFKTVCRYCSRMFMSRLSLIIHEQKHMRFKQNISGLLCQHCDIYIAGNFVNLASHIDAKHSKDKSKIYSINICKKCGLQYRSYKHHMYNYHSPKCCNINKFITDNQFKNHLEKCLCHTHVLSICRLCYTIMQVDNNFKCVTLGIKRTSGILQDCKKCHNKVHEIISVKLSCKMESKFHYWYVQDRPISNKDRLRNIRMRLKKLNIMSKMYCFVSFVSYLEGWLEIIMKNSIKI